MAIRGARRLESQPGVEVVVVVVVVTGAVAMITPKLKTHIYSGIAYSS